VIAGARSFPAWLEGVRTQALTAGAAAARRSAHDAQQAELFRRAFDRLGTIVSDMPFFPATDLPVLVYRALTGRLDDVAVGIAAACACVYLGADTLDDVADGDDRVEWAEVPASVVSLTGSTILAALPQRLLLGLPLGEQGRLPALRRLTDGLLEMSAGQRADLALRHGPFPDVDTVERAVRAKSGGEMATFAGIAALAAGAPDDRRATAEELGAAIGTAGQLASDISELTSDSAEHRDLVGGARTMPIVWHMRRLDGEERDRFAELLEAARTDAAARRAVQAEVVDAGTARRCAVVVQIHCQRAHRLADALAGGDAAVADPVHRIIDALAFFPTARRSPAGIPS